MATSPTTNATPGTPSKPRAASFRLPDASCLCPSKPENHRPKMPITRLAPSPTGALHLGNARTFLVNWALARQRGWRIVLRIEDLDGPRIKPGAAEQAIADLSWLGLDWDEGPCYQRADLAPYSAALARLEARGLV